MLIELPGPLDIEAAVEYWKTSDPRFAALLRRYGDTPRALRHYGLTLWEAGTPEAAAKILTVATALTPSDARLWSDLSGAFSASGQLPQAAACMEESLRRDETQPQGWLRLGSIRSGLADPAGAEAALRKALVIEPGSLDAALSLGLVYLQAKRFPEAVHHLGAVVRSQPGASAAIRTCYAQALSHSGAFSAAAVVLRGVRAEEPHNPAVTQKLAQAEFISALIDGGCVEDATTACHADPALTATAFEKISRQSFHLLGAHGHLDAARRLGEARLAAAPDDPERQYLLAILKGENPRRAPDAYVASFFNQFATEFDHQLVDILGYKAFQSLATLVDAQGGACNRVLDCGCGTGLSGPLLARPGRHLTGLDLSSGMLDKARARGCYDALIEGEAVAYLADRHAVFDLVFASDVLIYIGDVTALMRNVSRALVPGGFFAFTIETSDKDLAVLACGRFAHGLAHTLALAEAASLVTRAVEHADIRFETHGFVAGALVVLERV